MDEDCGVLCLDHQLQGCDLIFKKVMKVLFVKIGGIPPPCLIGRPPQRQCAAKPPEKGAHLPP
jgi:hypothetical protein